jgi:hypothetical protein
MSNNMLDILKNFDAAEKGKKPSAAAKDVNDMKVILESLQECGMGEMSAPTQEQPVTVSVTASGKDNVADLISLMQQAAGIEQHVDMPMAHDAHIDKDSHNTGEPDMAAMKAAIMGVEEAEEEEDFENAPEDAEGAPEYQDHHYMTKTLSGGINKQKKMYAKAQDGDNAMAVESIKEQLMKALEGKYKNDAQRKAVHAAKSKKNESDVDEAHGNSKVYDKCWDGYEKVPGKKRGEPGSCRKK